MRIVSRRLALSPLIALLLAACDKAPDEEQIAQHIAAMQTAIEEKNFTAIKAHLHDDFIANGGLDAMEVNRLLQMYSLQHRTIGITIIDSETALDPAFYDRAESTLSVVVTGSSGLLPSDGNVQTVTLGWVKESGDWLLSRADWQHYQPRPR